MKKYNSLIIAAVCAFVLAAGLTYRITSHKIHFYKTVKEALKTSEGYDQKFIDMVNRLEQELALRAAFGYSGQKDPMTGKERIVVKPLIKNTKRKTTQAAILPLIDPVKLTAIIYDDSKHIYTAIMMDDERSYAVEIGDKIAGRKITRISNKSVSMEDSGNEYLYDITGKSEQKNKN